MERVVLLVLALVGMVSPMPSGASPWAVRSSLCSPGDPPAVCQLKKSKCVPISKALIGPAGPVNSVLTCANTTGVVPDPLFFMGIGMAFAQGNPETLVDHVTSDPSASIAIRRCVFNATGLANPDLTLNRTAVAARVTSALVTPTMVAAVAAVIPFCPEPVDYRLTDLITCLETACMNSVPVSPFMAMGASFGAAKTPSGFSPVSPTRTNMLSMGYFGAP
ncbi:uncharacterized protein LOC121871424 [Homarus americanus]|uniref:Uncharacterized protein n=1 Tax=Homarus americanus TaxID=6706 RepID=A0A8J5MVA0_HOMAM|nr:uncharacterized protein LOC121871424 [Homarus americanus]KAG7164647.1 hypothetical protein Hamer_G005036 [Homarus americanus]